jgi:hypothetical protein
MIGPGIAPLNLFITFFTIYYKTPAAGANIILKSHIHQVRQR